MSVVHCININKQIDTHYEEANIIYDRTNKAWYLPSIKESDRYEIRDRFHEDTYKEISEYMGWGFESNKSREKRLKLRN